ncbi:MAG: ATP-binding cassette domain-containing protein [Pseudomonadota bacterium]
MSVSLLSTAGLSLGYRDTPILKNVAFELVAGEVFAVVGHNGSGKSTLVKTLLGNLPPLGGKLRWPNGKPNSIACLGQRTEFDQHFPIRVRDLAAMGAWSGLRLTGKVDSACQQRIESAMIRTGIDHIADMPLYQLSAGQLQRALFARTIVQDASLIFLDEPFTAVDQTTEAELLTLIEDWSDENRTVVLVLHDLSAVLQHCDSALLLGSGRSLFGSPEDILTTSNLLNFGYLSESQASWFESMYAQPETQRV